MAKGDLLPFDKRLIKKKKKEPKGPTRKQERKAERIRQYEEHDSDIYRQVQERAYDWVHGCAICEYCHERPAEQMHHQIHRSLGGETSLDNVVYICLQCHNEKGHNLSWA
jgi:5-methylcytosine-specific restriction endonuclease McrA